MATTGRREAPDKGTTGVKVEYRGTGFYVSVILILVIGAMLLILAVQNTGAVTVQFLGLEFQLPLFAVIVGAGMVAVLLDELIGLVWRHQRRNRLEERAELQRLRAENQKTGNGPTGVEYRSSGTDPTGAVGTTHDEGGARIER